MSASLERPLSAVIDIDGVLADGTKEQVYSDAAGWAYEHCSPIEKGFQLLHFLRERGFRIVLYTARLEEDREITLAWLKRYEAEFDYLVMGKPYGDVYVDDRSVPWTVFKWLPTEQEADLCLAMALKVRGYDGKS
jgi:hypothetical protein